MKLRKEFDSIGSVNVPNDKYWGVSTQRSNKFFNIGKILVNISIVKSIAIIKRSAAIVHSKDKLISSKISKAIIKASDEVIRGKLDENGKPIYNESGKVMKGPNYFKPDLSKFVS